MQYKNTVLTNTTIASFMAFLDSNIVVISLPTIIRTLPGTTAFDGLWLVMGYSIVSATFLLALGRLADIVGRVKLYNSGFALFTVASGLCSLAPNGETLVIFRMIQGLGGALIFANNNAIITDAFPPTERGRAIGVNQVTGIAGSVIALVLGGILTSTLGWRSIFWINLAPGAFATVWAYKRLHEVEKPKSRERIDKLGNLLFGPGLALFLYGSTFGALTGWSALDIAFMVAGMVMILGFVKAETASHHPMMDLSLFRIRAFAAGAFSNLLSAVARGGLSLVLVIYFQGALLLNAFQSGVDLIPFSLAFVSAGPLSGALSDRMGQKPFIVAGLATGTVALLIFAFIPLSAPYYLLVIPMVLAGLGGGMFAAPNVASIMNSVPPLRRGISSGMSSLLFNVGALLSLSMSFIIMATSISRPVLEAIFAGLPVAGGLNLQLYSGAMHRVFGAMALVNGVALVPTFIRETKAQRKTEVVHSNPMADGHAPVDYTDPSKDGRARAKSAPRIRLPRYSGDN
jgi:EmrB/QacA subfamily drug resistance transporter